MNESHPTPSESTPQANPPKPVQRYRRRRRRRLVLKIAVILLIVLLGVLIYGQSGHALRHVYLPIASHQLGTSIMAADGSLSYGGALRLEGLSILGSDGQPALTLERLAVKIKPGSLLSGMPVVNQVQVVKPHLFYRIAADGSNNWDFLPASPEAKQPMESLPAFQLDQAKVSDLAVDYADASGLRAQISQLNLTVTNLAPGTEGQIGLDGQALFERADQGIRQQGGLEALLTVRENATRQEMDYHGTVNLNLKGLQTAGAPVQAVDMATSLSGRINLNGTLEQTVNVLARTPDGPVGQIEGELHWDPAAQRREARLIVSDVSREFLNPLLTAVAPVQLARGALRATVDVHGEGPDVVFTTDLAAQGLSFTGQGDATPPVDVTVEQAGRFAPDTRTLDLQTVAMTIQRGGTRVVDLALNQPIQFKLAAGAGQALAGASAELRLEVRALTIDLLRPWLALAGVDAQALAALEAGTFEGGWTVAVAEQGQQLALQGELTGSGIKHAALASAPLDFTQSLDVRLDKMNEASIKAMSLKASTGGRAIVEAAVTGDYALDRQAGTVAIQSRLPKILATAQTLGLLKGPAPEGVGDGQVVANQKIQIEGNGQKVAMQGDARLEGMTLALRGGAPAPLGATVTDSLTLDRATGRLAIAPLRVELTQPGSSAPGVVAVQGDWPLAATGQGKLEATVRNVDLAPWLRMLRLTATDTVPPIPLEAEETLERADDGTLRLAGEVRLGLPIPAEGDVAAGQRQVTLTDELTQLGQQIEKLVLTLAAEGAGGEPDRITLEGSGMLDAEKGLQLVASVPTLNLNPYLAMKTAYGPPPAASPAPAPETAPVPPPLKVAVDWTVGQATVHGGTFKDGAGTLHYDQGQIAVKVAQGTLAEGALTADASYDMTRLQPRYAWKMGLTDAQMPGLLQFVSGEMAGKMTGTGTFASEGTGEGLGEALLQKLDSRSSMVVKDGELSNLPILDRLSEVTRSSSFQRLKFFEVTGGLNFQNGTGRVENTAIKGPENKIAIVGTIQADQSYAFDIIPFLKAEAIQRDNMQQYALLGSDQDGYIKLPVKLAVQGKGAQYSARPQAELPIGGAGQDLGSSIQGVVGGLVQRELDRKNKPDAPATADQPGTATADQPGTATAVTTETLTPLAPAPPEKTPAPSTEDQLRGILGGIVRDGLGSK